MSLFQLGPAEFVGRYMLMIMEWLNNNLINSYALSIIIFTLCLKIITMPADIHQRRSSAKLAAHNPEIQKIQKRYESNPETMQKKVSEYYKKNNIKPQAGCLPAIITLIFFMVFLRAMSFWGNIKTIELYNNPTIEHSQTYKWAWVHNIWMPDNGFTEVIMPYEQFKNIPFAKLDKFFEEEEIEELSNVTEQEYFDRMGDLVSYYNDEQEVKNGWFILPLLSALSMLLSQFITKKFSPQMTQDNPQTANMNSPTMMFVMAIISFVVCLTSNAAFALYWTVSNLCMIALTIGMGLWNRYNDSREKEAAL